jgi:hypothetical protein
MPDVRKKWLTPGDRERLPKAEDKSDAQLTLLN